MTDEPEEKPWNGEACGRDGLRLAAALISFQRFSRPVGDVVERAPRSLGALPVGRAANGFLLPVADNEAFWIGAMLSRDSNPCSVTILADRLTGGRVPVARLDRPQTAIIAGIIRPDGRFDIFSRHSISAIEATANGRTARVEPVHPALYAAVTGNRAAEPLDPAAGFGGWRLP